MPAAASFANDTLDQEYPNAASGTVVIGSTTYTLPVRVQFLQTVSTDTAAGTALGSPVSAAGAFATAASAKSKPSSAAITLASAPAGTWADVETVDSTGTPKRMNFRGGTSLGKTVNAGDSLIIPAGQFIGTRG